MPQPLILEVDLNDKSNPKIKALNTNLKDIEQNAKRADKGIGLLGKGFGRLGGIAGGVVRSLFSMKGAIAALGLGYVAKGAVDTAAKFDQMRVALDTITKGKGVETFEALNRWALKMPVNTERAIEAFTKMKAMGLSPTIDEMTTLVDTTAALGGTPDIMDSIAMALGKISAKGKASARDILMFTERGVPAIEILKEELNDTSISFENIATSGHKADAIVQAMLTGMQKRFGGLAKNIQDRWSGLVETAKSWWKEFVRLVMDEGVLRYLEGKLKTLTDKIDELAKSGQLKAWAQSTGKVITDVLEKMFRFGKSVVDNWGNIRTAIDLVSIAVKAFLAYQLAAALGEIAFGAVEAAKNIGKLKAVLTGLNSSVAKMSIGSKAGLVGLALFGGYELGKYLNDKFLVVKQFGVALAAGLHKTFLQLQFSLETVWDTIKFGFEKMVQGVQWYLNGLVGSVNKILDVLSKIPKYGKKFGAMKLDEVSLKDSYRTTEDFVKDTYRRHAELNKKLAETEDVYFEIYTECNLIKETQKSTKETVAETTKELEVVKKKTQEVNEEAEEFKKIWEKSNETIRDGFLSNFADAMTGGISSFREFTNNMKDIWRSEMAKLASVKFFKPIAESLTGALTAPFQSLLGMGGKEGGLLGGLGSMLTKGGEKAGGGIESFAGALPILGGAAFIASTLLGKKKKQTPVMTISYDIESDKFKQVTDYWSGGAVKNTELMGQVESTLQKMIDMYGSLSKFANQDLQKMSITISNVGTVWSDIFRQIENIPIQFAIQYEDILTSVFGTAYETELAQQIEAINDKIMEVTLGKGTDYFWSHLMFFKEWRIPVVADLEKQLEELTTEFEEHIESLYTTFEKFGETFSEIIGKAFSDSLGTGGFTQFKSELSKNLYDLFRTQLLETFFSDFAAQAMQSIWGVFGVGGFEDLIGGVISGDLGSSDVAAMISSMVDSVEGLEPIFTAFNESLIKIDEAMGLNTDAINENTDILTAQQQIQDFIKQLTVGTLAPGQSVEAITGEYERLLGGENLQDLFSFVTGTMLPFFQTYGGNYQDVFAGVISDLQSLASSYAGGFDPSAIGETIAGAIGTNLTGGTYNITIEIDGNTLGSVLIDQLDSNGELVTKLNETIG